PPTSITLPPSPPPASDILPPSPVYSAEPGTSPAGKWPPSSRDAPKTVNIAPLPPFSQIHPPSAAASLVISQGSQCSTPGTPGTCSGRLEDSVACADDLSTSASPVPLASVLNTLDELPTVPAFALLASDYSPPSPSNHPSSPCPKYAAPDVKGVRASDPRAPCLREASPFADLDPHLCSIHPSTHPMPVFSHFQSKYFPPSAPLPSPSFPFPCL